MTTFQDKLQKLPQYVQDYLVSRGATDINISIYDKYGIDGEQSSTLTDLVTQIFFKELKLSEFQEKVEQKLGLNKDEARSLVRDIAGSRLLIIDDWLEEDVPAFIQNLGGESKQYQEYIEDLKQVVEKEQEEEEKRKEEREEEKDKKIKERISAASQQEEEPTRKELDPDKEKKDSVDIFKNSLVYLLDMEDKDILEEYNLLLIKLIADDEEGKFKKDLEKSLLANQEH